MSAQIQPIPTPRSQPAYFQAAKGNSPADAGLLPAAHLSSAFFALLHVSEQRPSDRQQWAVASAGLDLCAGDMPTMAQALGPWLGSFCPPVKDNQESKQL
jgi:hypothetical protein